MHQRYLYPQRKRAEVWFAIFSGGFGAHIATGSVSGTPLWWAGLGRVESTSFGLLMLGAALLWSIGININGRWRFSPLLRLISMFVSFCLFASLAKAGFGGTAGYVYGWITFALAYAVRSAFVDTKRALGASDGIRTH